MNTNTDISALVINLDTATERWEFQQKQLNHLCFKHERFIATSATDITEVDYDKWANDWQRKLRRTEVACFLSHYRVWQHIVKHQHTYLILEDDVLLSKNLPLALNTLSNENDLEYDLLNFETRGRKKLISKRVVYENGNLKLHQLFLDKSGSAAYLLTPAGAQKLLDSVAINGAGLVDAILCHTHTLKKLQSVPALALQMDMANHYDMPNLMVNTLAKSLISTQAYTKPKPDNLANLLFFKSRRVIAQLSIGLLQAKYTRQSHYVEVLPTQSDFTYCETLLNN